MKSLVNLLQHVLQDMEDRCHVSTTLDLKKILRRVEDEGLSFLSITLSSFGSDFRKGVDRGYVAHDLFTGFQWKDGLPLFLGGFLELVFDRGTGRLQPIPSIDAILCLHQFTSMWAKIAMPVSREREIAAIERYIDCEADVRSFDNVLGETNEGDPLGSSKLDNFRRIGSTIFGSVFTDVANRVYSGSIIPKHGPGSTADRLLGNAKWSNAVWTDRLEAIFPSGNYAAANFRDYLEREFVHLDPGSEIPVKVILVPKTLKTPRIIAKEPTHMQYMQQALLWEFVDAIERDSLARQLIGFLDQTPNQGLARKGSSIGVFATLDLSEASDRVSNQHVRALLGNHSLLAEAVDATRSRKADVPGHGVIRLAKFASMGSALCFPLEAMVFCTVVFMGIEKSFNRRLTRKDIKLFLGQVRVYGDDIIVPVEFTNTVVRELEAFGFRVNSGKSFWTGKFRESCGKDYYDGHDITCVRLRRLLPSQRWNKEESEIIISTVETRNQFYLAGWEHTTAFFDELFSSLGWDLPFVGENSPGIGLITRLPIDHSNDRYVWDLSLQRLMVKAMVVKETPSRNSVDGYPALLKFFVKRSDLPVMNVKHLLYSGRPRSVDIKLRMVPVY